MKRRAFGLVREPDADLLTVGRVLGALGDLAWAPASSKAVPELWVLALGPGPAAPEALLAELEAGRGSMPSPLLIIAHPRGLPRAEDVQRRLTAGFTIAATADGFRYAAHEQRGLGHDAADLLRFLGQVANAA